MFPNDHLKRKSKVLCIHSLVLEVIGLKQGYTFFISVLSYLIYLQAGLNLPRKEFKKRVSSFPYFFQGVT